MKERLQKKFKELQKKDKKGFTLIELIVVLVILGIVLAITVPTITGYIDEAKNGKYLAEAHSVFVVAEVERARAMVSAADPAADWTPTDPDSYAKKAGVKSITAISYTKTGTKYTITYLSQDGTTVNFTAVGNDKIEIVSKTK